jgi:glycerol-3-phosphate cytidylyltransferase-like family protein
MEIHVLGSVSQINEQLRSTLDGLERELGIDIVALDYDAETSALSLSHSFGRIGKNTETNRIDPTVGSSATLSILKPHASEPHETFFLLCETNDTHDDACLSIRPGF